ncbi:hypothetical protein QBC34DRAFT_458886, partial [Podospora aff. communis PSN243]
TPNKDTYSNEAIFRLQPRNPNSLRGSLPPDTSARKRKPKTLPERKAQFIMASDRQGEPSQITTGFLHVDWHRPERHAVGAQIVNQIWTRPANSNDSEDVQNRDSDGRVPATYTARVHLAATSRTRIPPEWIPYIRARGLVVNSSGQTIQEVDWSEMRYIGTDFLHFTWTRVWCPQPGPVRFRAHVYVPAPGGDAATTGNWYTVGDAFSGYVNVVYPPA